MYITTTTCQFVLTIEYIQPTQNNDVLRLLRINKNIMFLPYRSLKDKRFNFVGQLSTLGKLHLMT